MSKYLVRTVETYRIDNEAEAKKAIEEAKNDKAYTLSKYSDEYKCAKSKGEIIDEWHRVTLTKDFNVEKDPDMMVDISYSTSEGYFPEPINNTEEENRF